MANTQASIEADIPVRQAYNHWTRFERFPHFMEGIKEVKQIDDTRLAFCGEIGGVEREWTAEILDQVPDRLIRWRSMEGPQNGGTVRFSLGEGGKTRIELDYEPETFVEKVGDLAGVFDFRVKKDLQNFKEYVEKQGPTEGWRGEIHGGTRTL